MTWVPNQLFTSSLKFLPMCRAASVWRACLAGVRLSCFALLGEFVGILLSMLGTYTYSFYVLTSWAFILLLKINSLNFKSSRQLAFSSVSQFCIINTFNIVMTKFFALSCMIFQNFIMLYFEMYNQEAKILFCKTLWHFSKILSWIIID